MTYFERKSKVSIRFGFFVQVIFGGWRKMGNQRVHYEAVQDIQYEPAIHSPHHHHIVCFILNIV